MKKTTRTLLIMLAVLAVLGGASAALLLFPAGGRDTESEAPTGISSAAAETQPLLSGEAAEVESVSLRSAADSYVLVKDGEGFTVQGYEDCAIETGVAAAAVESLGRVTVSRDLGERDNLADFGLTGESAVQMDVAYAGGKKDSLTVGALAGESSGRYVLKDGKVYLCSAPSALLLGDKFGFFNTALYSIPDRETENDNEPTDILYHLELSGAAFPEPIRIVFDTSVLNGYIMRAPVTAESGTSLLTETILPELKSMSGASVVAARLSEADLEAFGLKEPAAVADFDLNNVSHVLKVSAAKDGSRYLLLDDRDVIYRISDSAVADWAAATVMKLRMSYVWLTNISDTQRLELTAGRKRYAFTAERTVNEDKTTADRTVYDLNVTAADGAAVDYKSYQSFYMELLGVTVLNTDPAEYSRSAPAYQAVFHTFDGETVEISYYAAGSDRYAAELNGAYNGQVRKASVESAFALLEDLS